MALALVSASALGQEPPTSDLGARPVLDFEVPGALTDCTFAGQVARSEPSPEAAHSGNLGLKLHFGGAPGATGGQYFATSSPLAGAARAIRFWLLVQDHPGKSTLTVTLASGDYQVQWHHPVPLEGAGWREIVLPAEGFAGGGPPGRTLDWEENRWVYFEFRGDDPLTVCLDDVALLIDPALGAMEPFLENDRNAIGRVLFNSRLQVASTTTSPALLTRVSAFRRALIGQGAVMIDGESVDLSALASANGKVTVGGREHQVTGAVTSAGRRVKVALSCVPECRLTYRLPLDGSAYTNQDFALDDLRGRLRPGPAGLLAQAESVSRVSLGSLSQRTLTFEVLEGIGAALSCDGGGRFFLDLLGRTGSVAFSLRAPQEDIALSLATDRHKNLYDFADRDALVVRARLENNTARPRWCNYQAAMTDFAGRRVFRQESSARLPASGSVELLLRPRLDRLGFYKLVLTAQDSLTGEEFRRFITLGLIAPPVRHRPGPKDGRFGLTFFARTPQLAGLASRLGITWTRDNIYWTSMEPERGQYNWDPMDQYSGNALGAGLWTMPVNGDYGAPWAQLEDGHEDRWGKHNRIDLSAWTAWWEAMAQRYRGKVGAWEIANETYFVKNVPFVVETHVAAYDAIKRQDPEAPVLANVIGVGTDWATDFARDFLAAGGDRACDVVSCHPYLGFTTSPEAARMYEVTQTLKDLAGQYGKPLWWTEWAYFGDDERDPFIPGVERDWGDWTLSERAQAQYIVRSFLAGLRADVDHMFYFLNEDTRTWQFPAGIIREEGIKPAVPALSALCRALEFTEFVQDVELRDDVQIIVCRGEDHVAAALWSAASPERPERLTIPLRASDVEALDFMGNRLLSRPGAREISLTMDGCPSYLLSRTLSAEALAKALTRAKLAGGPPATVGRVFLRPGDLEVELLNPDRQAPASAQVKLLDPPPAEWALEEAPSASVTVPPAGSSRVRLATVKRLPAPERPATLRLQVSGGSVIEREYSLLPVPRAVRALPLQDDPATWGEPTCVLETADRTTSCPALQTPNPGWQGPQDLSARLWLRWDDQRLHAGLVVRDDVQHEAATEPSALWQHDSVQYGFDAAGNVPAGSNEGWDSTDDSEWLAGLFRGQPTFWRHANPFALTPGPVEGAECVIRRQGDLTSYVAALPWSLLPPAVGEAGTILGFNLIVNDDDGSGREGWVGITPGIGETKKPSLFRKVLLVE